MWFKNDNNVPDGRSMYTYDGSNWIKFDGSADASRLQIGTIDASKINVMNVSASNITTGTLSANFLKGGQIDASQINVINMNASNLTAGIIDATKIGIVGTSSKLDLTGNSMSIKSTNSSIPWSATFDKNGMELVTQAAGNTVENVGGIKVLYSSGNENINGIYLALNKNDTTGQDFAGDEVGIAYSTGTGSDGLPNYSAAMLYNATGSGGKTPGFHFYKQVDIHGQHLEMIGSTVGVNGMPNALSNWLTFSGVSWSSYWQGKSLPTIRVAGGSGIAFGDDNIVLYTNSNNKLVF